MNRDMERLLSVTCNISVHEESKEEDLGNNRYGYLEKRRSLHYPMGKYLMHLSAKDRESTRSTDNIKRSCSVIKSDVEGEFENKGKDNSINAANTEFRNQLNSPFHSKFKANEMRCLALVAHNNMKPAMKSFIETHSEILKKFRLVGTNTTMTMCKTVFGRNNPDVVYGPECTSGPLGGDAQLCALMCLENIGGVIFFIDPLSPHPHQADIDSLIRLCNVHNVLFCTNPTSAISTMHLLHHGLTKGKKEMMASFFQTLESPSVPEYKAAQKKALAKAVAQQ